ncbi:type 1 glutamine amidotransferase [Pelomonas saccharophila]|uniref:Type 1 glutamine amidotransferase n=1 Tax=Roseateles saccharophilus TaxID=304 RepID=A0ABU1YP63_ROSSA|nr:ThuA domain-containing protein [Roseateles saccharophilus]MDR7270653.1 type 1 glutamine amidotransferase [Roseateles saccharophilus]
MKKTLHTLAVAAAVAGTTVPAQARDGQFSLLVLAMPSKYHYEYIPIARESFEKLAKLHAFELMWTAQPGAFEGDLSKYAAVVLLNSSGEEFNEAQRTGFERYMRSGGNAVVVHRAIISKPGMWPWYEKLVGRSFIIHPMLQTAVVTKADAGHPATFGLPDRWIWSDEWYEFSNPHGITIHPVLAVDERSYDPTKIWPGQVAKGMGADHPVSWWHPYEKGRVFVTALGHNGEMYREGQYLEHLWGGVWWAATGLGVQRRP